MATTACVDRVLTPPSEKQLQLIRQEINEDEERLRHVENLLDTWISCQPHFPEEYDKAVTRSFIRNCKFNIEKVKLKLERYLIVRNLYPELFSNRSPFSKDVAQALDTIVLLYLPKMSDMGSRISIYKLIDYDPSHFDLNGICKLFFMSYDVMLSSQHPSAGEIAIFDAEGLTPNHFVKFLSIIKVLTPILKKAYAVRLKEIHIVNASSLVDKVVNAIKPLLHHKVRNSFVNHSSSKSLCSYFGDEILPSDYGGQCKPLTDLMKDWRKMLNDNENWFIEQENMQITKAIPKKIENEFCNQDFGVEGSFRMLQID